MAKNRSRQFTKKRAVFAVLTAFLILVVGLLLYKQLDNNKKPATDDDGIIYTEATEQEKAESEAAKERIAEQEGSNNEQSSANGDKAFVSPVITSWGQQADGSDFTLNGYVPSVVEDDGTCTLRMKKGEVTVEESKIAFFNAQSTSCGQIRMPYSKLSKGEWTVTLAYASSKSEGISQELKVEIK